MFICNTYSIYDCNIFPSPLTSKGLLTRKNHVHSILLSETDDSITFVTVILGPYQNEQLDHVSRKIYATQANKGIHRPGYFTFLFIITICTVAKFSKKKRRWKKWKTNSVIKMSLRIKFRIALNKLTAIFLYSFEKFCYRIWCKRITKKIS